jgi:hypothetical protein
LNFWFKKRIFCLIRFKLGLDVVNGIFGGEAEAWLEGVFSIDDCRWLYWLKVMLGDTRAEDNTG